ncbi:MAG: flagellar motor protein MotB [Mixta calida]|uniref:flagellar motor protein MotB n=1 Tax=Mixta TaxID=2100764 RepID=UPI001680F8E1|nr:MULTISPECIES: flagellar motor protein MotB [Mixta]MDU3817344.1 flagellar motor protein MotB [Pantoea sp.]MCR1567801.1 flagellar motor protein MotB [Mixta sp.]MDU2733096.1 flagellar motor protein MotB [Mixta calida]MDU4943086.1 flagellar motor protein MotB [Mixta calida]QNU43530.1 flagellar motor protein MotB [Mixta calida]
MSKHKQPIIIIRKRKKHGHDHHGGSWKIAYADFMTAMMAFFLVMWLIANSSPQQRHRIAEYFQMPLKVALSQGNQSSLSDSVIPGGGDDLVKKEGEVNRSRPRDGESDKDIRRLKKARERLESLIKSDPRLSNFQSNLRLQLTENGLLIQIIDTQDRPMFKLGSKELESYLMAIFEALVPVLNELPNRISLTGHTDSLPYAQGDVGYSNWELSSDRANASRRALISAGLTANKFLRVIGTADSMVLENTAPDSPINRRISILVLTQNKEKAIIRDDNLIQSMTENSNIDAIKSELKITPQTDEGMAGLAN